MLEDLPATRQLRHLAQVHHGNTRADVLDDAQVVRDEQIGQPQLLLQVHQNVEDLRLHRDVQRRDRLIRHDKLRIQSQRARNTDALALPTGELVWITFGVEILHIHHTQQIDHALPTFLRRADPMHHKPFHNALTDGHARIERRIRVLEHNLDVATQSLQLAATHREDVPTVEVYFSTGMGDQSQHGTADGRFPTPGLADQTQRLAALDGKTYPVNGLHLSRDALKQAAANREILDQVFDDDKVFIVSRWSLHFSHYASLP